MFVIVANLCALVDGGQHLFFFVLVLDGDFFFLRSAGRVLRHTAISKGAPICFGVVTIRNSQLRSG